MVNTKSKFKANISSNLYFYQECLMQFAEDLIIVYRKYALVSRLSTLKTLMFIFKGLKMQFY